MNKFFVLISFLAISVAGQRTLADDFSVGEDDQGPFVVKSIASAITSPRYVNSVSSEDTIEVLVSVPELHEGYLSGVSVTKLQFGSNPIILPVIEGLSESPSYPSDSKPSSLKVSKHPSGSEPILDPSVLALLYSMSRNH
jgi:hypothetical protein